MLTLFLHTLLFSYVFPLLGKGRQIAGMIFDSLLRGNSTRHLWLSVSSDLYLEANRDLQAIGCKITVFNGIQSIDESMAKVRKNWTFASLPERLKNGVLFSTYSTLVSGMKVQRSTKRKDSRLQQIVNWCGPNFDGLIILDECHRSKNYKTMSDGSTDESSSLTGQAVVKLQEMLPRARLVYASATGVTNISDLNFMTRLGLWGKGQGFEDFKTFERVRDKKK